MMRVSRKLMFALTVLLCAVNARAVVLHSAVPVSDSDTDNTLTYPHTTRKLACGPDGTIYVVYRSPTSGIRLAKSTNRGESFDASVQISAVAYEAEVAVGSDEVVHVAYVVGTSAMYCRSTDGGATFSAPASVGNITNGIVATTLHIAVDAPYVYIVPTGGMTLLRNTDSGAGVFTSTALGNTRVFSDVHVDPANGDVIVVTDDPSVRYFVSTDHAATFGNEEAVGSAISYSTAVFAPTQDHRYIYTCGSGSNALRIDIDTGATDVLTFGTTTQSRGRTLSVDSFGNVVDGYVSDDEVVYAVSSDNGETFDSPVSVATANYFSIGLNSEFDDIVAVYEVGGRIYCNVYTGEIITPNTDSDGDGTPDQSDGCPSDANKIAPGICGCGVADTDTDGDGTADCNDGCLNDADKTAPGICGCGVADTDTDGDGTADCDDDCPNDANKTALGICGCGVADTDTDGDGTADCDDGCPNDADKTAPGACGCDVADTDTDDDGTADCNDQCDDDPNKTAPGTCGCGTADTDADNDGTPDCNDVCSDDPLKTTPDSCGCGVAETDTDSDGTWDCQDTCPNDPAKTQAGACGCGVAETDTDGDGTPDCNDTCPNDPAKTQAGICGCGVADVDTDQDTTPDCNDLCPEDANKTTPGTCGCGSPDVDTDNDGTLDCEDGCPNDPDKTEPGHAGCGESEQDKMPNLKITITQSQSGDSQPGQEGPDLDVGDEVDFTVDVENNGGGDANNVIVNVPLPPQMEFISARILNLDTGQSAPNDVQVFEDHVEIDLGHVPPGSNAQIELKLRAKTSGAVKLEASAQSDEVSEPVKVQEETEVKVNEQYVEIVTTTQMPMCGLMGFVPLMLTAVWAGICVAGIKRR